VEPIAEEHLVGEAEGAVRVVMISDTHGKHREIRRIPAGDVLIHAGDITASGELKQLRDFEKWMGTLPHPHKVVIAGNHDKTLDKAWAAREEQSADKSSAGIGSSGYGMFKEKKKGRSRMDIYRDAQRLMRSSPHFHYLEGEALCVAGLTIYGSPFTPRPAKVDWWGFGEDRGHGMQKCWAELRQQGPLDILVSHGPPLGYGDLHMDGHTRIGCTDLLLEVMECTPPPRYHVFGHVHEGHGVTTNGSTIFINASTCTHHQLSCGRPRNPPIVLDIQPRYGEDMGETNPE